MTDQLSRTRMLLGAEGVERLNRARVAVFGLGGVGSYVAVGFLRFSVRRPKGFDCFGSAQRNAPFRCFCCRIVARRRAKVKPDRHAACDAYLTRRVRVR